MLNLDSPTPLEMFRRQPITHPPLVKPILDCVRYDKNKQLRICERSTDDKILLIRPP